MANEPPTRRLPWETSVAAPKKRRFYRRVEFYLPLIIIAGIVFAVLMYNQAMHKLGVRFDPASTGSSAPLTAAFRAPGAPEVALYVSPDTAHYLKSVGGDYEVLVKPWRDFLTEAQRPFREISRPEELAATGAGVLVVPSAVALGEGERKAFVAYQKNGGSILATGAFGVRDEKGEWRGWAVTRELFGIEATDEIGPQSEERYLATVGDAPTTHLLEAGSRIWLGHTAEPPLRFKGGTAAGWLTDWARTPNGKAAAILYGARAKARWVQFGFSENSWDFRPTPVKALMAGALDWLQRRPTVIVAPWPHGRQSAQIVGVELDTGDHAESFAGVLDLLKIRGTFFAPPGGELAPVTANLRKNHELALASDLPALLTEAKGVDTLRQQREAPAGIVGLNTRDGKTTPEAENLAARAGFSYILSDANRIEHRLPFFADAQKKLLVLPRTQRDDQALLHSDTVPLEETAGMLKGEQALTRVQGGLGILQLHASRLARDSLISQASSIFLMSLAEQRDRVWLTSAREVADWWQQRAGISAALNQVGVRYELAVSNRGPGAVEGVSLIVFHPDDAPPRVAATKAWLPVTRVTPLGEFRSRVEFDPIKPGNYAYQVVFEK